MPFGPVDGEQHFAVRSAGQEVEPPGGEFEIVDLAIAQQPVEAVHGAVEPGPQPGRQRRRDGERPRLASGGNSRDDQSECLAACLVKGLEKAG